MNEFEIFLRLVLAIGLGALVGTEREKLAKKRDKFLFGGIRTFTIISVLGAIAGLLFLENNTTPLILSFSALTIFLAISYFYSVKLSSGKEIGVAGEIAALIIFFCGFMVFTKHIFLSVAIAIITATFLYLKERIHNLLTKISEEEVYNTLVFAVIAFVILPFLPNQEFGPLGVLNPHKIWFMVVLICAIGYCGYFLIRFFGSKKGIVLTGFLGGLVSSTAVTMTMAQKSKEEKDKRSMNMLVFGTIVANTVMFARVAAAVFIVNNALLVKLLPTLITMGLVGTIAAAAIWFRSDRSSSEANVQYTSPFRIGPAVKFGVFFAVILFLLKAAQNYFGSTGIYIASIISGFADVDAVTLSMATIAGIDISEKIAATAIIFAVMSNTIIKLGYCFTFGSKEFSKKIGMILGTIVLSGFLAIFLF